MAVAATSDIEYSSAKNHFEAKIDSNHFWFSDKLGSRSLDIKKCNKALVDKFWDSLLKHSQDIQSSGPKSKILKLKAATLKFEKIEYPILEIEPAFKFFNHVPQDSNVLFIESIKKCKSK
jgi:hypothetical protein